MATIGQNMSVTIEATRLRGHLSVLDVIFMVVATSTPLTVIVALYPIGYTIGNEAGFPAADPNIYSELLVFISF